MKHKYHIVFFTGAGISKESGIPTFRDNNGLWSNHKLEEVASIEGLTKTHNLYWIFIMKEEERLKKLNQT